jgi:3,4-dihydroxy 2-butanone 4-phosphate synthase/GTP cyclohydrolase II
MTLIFFLFCFCADLCKMAGKFPAGALCEVRNEDGSMSRRDALFSKAWEWDLGIVSIESMREHLRKA